MATDKKDTRAAWDEAGEEEAKSSGVSPAVAKALLAMNPALREQGLDTMKVVRQSQDASAGVAQKPAAASAGGGVYDTLKALDLDVRRRDADIAAKIAALETERRQMHESVREQLSQWLTKHDPDILSPVSQSALKDFEKLLQLVGWKAADYVNKYRKKK